MYCALQRHSPNELFYDTGYITVLHTRQTETFVIGWLQRSWSVWNGSSVHSVVHYDCVHVCKWNDLCFPDAMVQPVVSQ